MQEHKYTVKTLEDTGRLMYALVKRFSGDLGEFANYSLEEFFNHVKKIPYKKDPDGIEYLTRPEAFLKSYGRGQDCDDRAITIGSWAKENGLQFRFIATGKHKDKPIHHVYPEILIGGKWIVADATYPENVLGYEIFKPERKQILKEN